MLLFVETAEDTKFRTNKFNFSRFSKKRSILVGQCIHELANQKPKETQRDWSIASQKTYE